MSGIGRVAPLLLGLFGFLPGPGTLLAQTPEAMVAQYRRSWRNASSVCLKQEALLNIQRNDTGLHASCLRTRDVLRLKTLSGQVDKQEVYYSTTTPLKEIKAWTMVPNGKRHVRQKVTGFLHKDVVDDEIFHDDQRSVQFMFPSVVEGAITHEEYTVEYNDVEIFPGYFFALNRPVEESSLIITCDKDIDVRALPFNIPDGGLTYERQENRGLVTHRWTMTKVPALVWEPRAPSFFHFAPHVRIIVRDRGRASGDDLAHLHAWMRNYVDLLFHGEDTLLTHFAQREVTGLEDDRAKAAKLFAWTQEHIKYIAVEDGINGLRPADARDVYRSRYGDCKGMSNLLRTLMEGVGLKAHLAWLGTRRLPYRMDEVPLLSASDHMVAVWETGDSLYVLDPTSEELPFGMPSAFIQGKQAMVSMDRDTFRILDVPVVPSGANVITDTLVLRLEGTTLTGSGSAWFTGYKRSRMVAAMRHSKPSDWPNLVRRQHLDWDARLQVATVNVEGIHERNQALHMEYSFTVPEFALGSGDEQFVPRGLTKPFSGMYFGNDRTQAVTMDHLWEVREVAILELPADVTIEFPEGSERHMANGTGYALGEVEVGTTPEGTRTLRFHNNYRMNTLLLEPGEEMKDWNSLLHDLEKDLNRSVVIKHNNP